MAEMAHQMKKKHFNKPTWCASCEKFIWGLVSKQGYACTACNYPCHPKCKSSVPSNCPGVKTNWGKKVLDDARERTGDQKKANVIRREDKSVGEVADEDIPEVEDTPVAEKKKKPIPKLQTQPTLLRLANGTKEEVATTFEDVYDVFEELGSGAFAVVKRVEHKKTGESLAAKIIDKKNVTSDTERLAVEMEVLRKVNHPNIIKLEDIFETDDFLYIVTEIVTGGELFDRIVSKGNYTERDAANLVKKVIEGLEYIHEMGIVHRDLKPENLLLKSKDNDVDVKIADFGLSKIMGSAAMTQTACGTPGYVAPEILKGSGYGKEVDMWSVGVITYILLCGFPPFYNENIPLLFESILKCDFDYPADYFDDITDSALDFIDALLVGSPKRRLSATEALKHPWLKDAPSTPLNVGRKMSEYNIQYKQQNAVMGPTT
uniref:Uncharacterized protein n=1 Tax=Vannella robusta TaxID=1487602 RepID=A0A7S4MH34_9EUKA